MGLGIATLHKWALHLAAGFPVAKLATHITVQVIAICIWLNSLATDSFIRAWAAFGLLTIGQMFGDLLMFASRRAHHPERKTRLPHGGQ